MNAELICIGSELLRGKPDQHGRFIGARLAALGIDLERQTLIADREKLIKETLQEAAKRSSIILIIGGLGPTFDDLTRPTVAAVLHRRLIWNEEIMQQILRRFKTLHRRMPKINRSQAYIIEGAKVIPNFTGTAPGMIVCPPEADGSTIIILPGPPQEMQPMWDKFVGPYLQSYCFSGGTVSSTLRVIGLTESAVDEKIRPIIKEEKNKFKETINFIILAHLSVVDIQINLTGRQEIITKEIERIKKKFYSLLKENIFGEGEDTLEAVAGVLLRKKGLTIAVAESCSGGLICHRFTNVPGSSDYFKEGVVSYDNKSKIIRLDVKEKSLRRFGAVSGEVALEMAEGVRRELKTDIGLAVTGIAGPSGGTKSKPVGLVFVGLVNKNKKNVYRNFFLGARLEIKEKAAARALDLLRRELITQ